MHWAGGHRLSRQAGMFDLLPVSSRVRTKQDSVLGGGSSTNLMMYTRGQRDDYDSWNTSGWSTDELLPYLKKVSATVQTRRQWVVAHLSQFETFHGQDPTGMHGDRGPINISGGTYRSSRSEDAFVAAAGKVGWSEFPDLQVLDANNGIQRAQRYVGLDGKRQDTASRYLHPLLQDGKHPNLHVLIEHQVVRVLFENNRAVGVEFKPNPLFHPDPGPTQSIRASKLVILSSGALGTPLILERSGVGDPSILSRASIPTIAPLPGVGRSYQDHNLLVYPYHSSLSPSETFDALADGRISPPELIQTNPSFLGWNGQDVTCKLRPRSKDIPGLGSAFQAAWERDFAPYPNRPLLLMSLVGAYGADRALLTDADTAKQFFSISTFSAYPYSRGEIHVAADGTSVDFDTGFFADERDVKMHVWSYKAQREMARRMECYRGEVAAAHPPFGEGSAARCGLQEGPVAEDEGEILYSEEDERVLEKWLRENVGTTWHSLGTCAMRPREEDGVVDGGLRVYGVEGLRVADLSVVPRNVAANTASTAMMIGEKAADLFARELELELAD